MVTHCLLQTCDIHSVYSKVKTTCEIGVHILIWCLLTTFFLPECHLATFHYLDWRCLPHGSVWSSWPYESWPMGSCQSRRRTHRVREIQSSARQWQKCRNCNGQHDVNGHMARFAQKTGPHGPIGHNALWDPIHCLVVISSSLPQLGSYKVGHFDYIFEGETLLMSALEVRGPSLFDPQLIHIAENSSETHLPTTDSSMSIDIDTCQT